MKHTTETKTAPLTPAIHLTPEERTTFIKAVKIGYYKEFYRNGLITGAQLELLLAKQNSPLNPPTG